GVRALIIAQPVIGIDSDAMRRGHGVRPNGGERGDVRFGHGGATCPEVGREYSQIGGGRTQRPQGGTMLTVAQLLRSKGTEVFSVTPQDSVLHAIEVMATRHV